MCGIAGIVALRGDTPSTEEIGRMCDSIRHRGPDDEGILVDGPVALGMRRLAIIDVQGGRQPMFNEDRSVAVVFNGEIYNFRALRAWLQERGHQFTTDADTEVIAHLWEELGSEFPARLEGMFAIALYDRRQRRIVLARDHVGIKPLYYCIGRERLVFGSEVKAVLAEGSVDRRLDVDAAAEYLSWEYVPGAATMLAAVRRLEPATTLVLDLATGTHTIQSFWDVPTAQEPDSLDRTDEWADQIDAAIRSAVQSQLVSDVPLGAFLSGGVDSSLVVAAMGAARTFSIGFEDPTYDETRWSKRVADHLGVDHRVEILRPDARVLFDELMQFMDDPIGDFSIFPTYLVSTMARRTVKVALTGDGGDELFGGYETYRAEAAARFWQRLPGWLRSSVIEPLAATLRPAPAKKGAVNKFKRFVEGASLDPALEHARWRLFCTEAMRRSLLTPGAQQLVLRPVGAHIQALQQRAGDRSAGNRCLYVDFRSYLVDNCLAKVDRMSMAASLEARVPLLDRELVELAFRLPARVKFDQRRSKILLKAVARRHLPADCVDRPKEGFSIPMKHWLKAEFRDLVGHYLDAERLRTAGLFEPATVTQLWDEHLSDRANHSHLLWSLLVFEQWRERWGVTL